MLTRFGNEATRENGDVVFINHLRNANTKIATGGTAMAEDDRRSGFDRRAGKDRRSGVDSRSGEEKRLQGERRATSDRRSGLDRRSNAGDSPKTKTNEQKS
jgi:hypothetical protein